MTEGDIQQPNLCEHCRRCDLNYCWFQHFVQNPMIAQSIKEMLSRAMFEVDQVIYQSPVNEEEITILQVFRDCVSKQEVVSKSGRFLLNIKPADLD